MAGEDVCWLYVPGDEIEQALALGASFHVGDSRLVMPRPLPPEVAEKDFSRWRSRRAVMAWLQEQAAEIIASEGCRSKIRHPETLGNSSVGRNRVYLFVRRTDAAEVRKVKGVGWDRRRRLFYAKREADLNKLFRWMTPAARRELEAERSTLSLVDQLVRDEAAAELNRNLAGTDTAGKAVRGGPKNVEPSR